MRAAHKYAKRGSLVSVDRSLYFVWSVMRDRCFNRNNHKYPRYGGRGITVCNRWDSDYISFIEDLGSRPAPGMSLDRIDNDGNYSCGKCDECIFHGWKPNVKWSTPQEQADNSTRVRLLTYNGRTQSVSQWTREKSLGKTTIRDRLCAGWSVDDAINTPIGNRRVVGDAA